MKYDQAYYSWLPENGSELNPQKGLGVKFSSNCDENFLKVWNQRAANKKSELTSRGLVTEYFQYIEPLKTFACLGVTKIDTLPEMKGRENQLVHIFTPAEEIDPDQPSSYIHRPEYARLNVLSKDICLEQVELPDCNFDYQMLLDRYQLRDCTRLAMLLDMEFSGYFEDARRAIVFPIDPDEPDVLSKTAAEITWLLHSWVPDGMFGKSAIDLKKNLGYVVGADAENKQCLCFIPRGGNTAKKQVFDLKKTYTKEELGQGAEFFLEMARRAQESPEAVRTMIDEVCRPLADTRPVLLGKVYSAYQYYAMLHTRTVPVGFLSSADEKNWRKKALSNGKDSKMAVNYCVAMLLKLKDDEQTGQLNEDQLREYWKILEKAYDERMQETDCQPFAELIADFINKMFEYASLKKDINIYLEKLKFLKKDAEEYDAEKYDAVKSHIIWKKLYEEGGCIRKHLRMISEGRADDLKGCLTVLEQCLSCYPGWIRESDFQDIMRTQTELLYETAAESGSSRVKERISELAAQYDSVYDADEWTRLELKIMDPAGDEFLEKYSELNPAVKPAWFGKAAEYLNGFRGNAGSLDFGLYRRYLQICFGKSAEEENYQAFCGALKALSEEGRQCLDSIREKKNPLDKRVFYLFLYQSCSDSRGWDNPEIWTEIEVRNFNTFADYREASEKKEKAEAAVLEEMLAGSNPQAIRLRAYCGFRSGEKLAPAVLSNFSGLYTTEEERGKTDEVFQKMRSWLWKHRPEGKKPADGVWENACVNYQRLYLAVFSEKDYKRFYDDFHKYKKNEYLEKEKFQEIFRRYIQIVKKSDFYRAAESFERFVENLEMYDKVRDFLEQADNQKLSLKEAEEYAKICKKDFLEQEEQGVFSSRLVKKAFELYLSKTEKSVLHRISSFMKEIDGWESMLEDSLRCDSLEEYYQKYGALKEHPEILKKERGKYPGLEQHEKEIEECAEYNGLLKAFQSMAAVFGDEKGLKKELERCMKETGISAEDQKMILRRHTEGTADSKGGVSDNVLSSSEGSNGAESAGRTEPIGCADGRKSEKRMAEKRIPDGSDAKGTVPGGAETAGQKISCSETEELVKVNTNSASVSAVIQDTERVERVKSFMGRFVGYHECQQKKKEEGSDKKQSTNALLEKLRAESNKK